MLRYLKNHPLQKTIFGAFFVCGILVSFALMYLATSQVEMHRQAQVGRTDSPSQNGLVRVAAKSANDTTPPQVTFVNPQDGLTLISDTELTVQVTARDDVHVSKIEIFIDDRLLKTCLSMTGCQTEVLVDGLSTGEHTLKSVVKDSSNNVTTAQIFVMK